MTTIVELDGIGKRYGETLVLKNVSLKVAEGDIVALIGPSGGRSTLLRIVNQLEHHQSGTLQIDGVVDPDAGTTEMTALRTKVGMVFQSFNLWPHLSAIRNVMEGPASCCGCRAPKPRHGRRLSSSASASRRSATSTRRSSRTCST